MKRSTSAIDPRMSSSDCDFQGSCRLSRNRSSPWSVQTIGALSLSLQRPRQADQQRERQIHDVEPRLRFEPAQHLEDLFALEAGQASQHRHRHLAEHRRIDFDLPFRRHPEHGVRIPQPIEKRRRVPEQRDVLLEVDADTAEQHARRADIFLIRRRRRVDRREQDVVAAGEQRRGQRVVAQATAAIHLGGAGGQIQKGALAIAF